MLTGRESFVDLWILYLNSLPVVLGALIGSFLNVVIGRWPEGKSVVRPHSACPRCDAPIAWYDNVPVFSYLALGARCRYCRTFISPRYPLVECLTALLSWLTFLRFVPDPGHVGGAQVAEYLFYFAFVAALIAITFIDFDWHLIPDEISLWGIGVGIVGVTALDRAGWGIVPWWSSILGAVLGAGVLLMVRLAYYLVRRREGMGLGDVKMLAMMGAFLGVHPALMFIIFVSSFLGSVVGILSMVLFRRDLKYELPFGPFLAIGGLLYLLWGYRVVELVIPADLPLEELFFQFSGRGAEILLGR
jgi:leader peptidase (prepilin peptidase)/N-methyltransferase